MKQKKQTKKYRIGFGYLVIIFRELIRKDPVAKLRTLKRSALLFNEIVHIKRFTLSVLLSRLNG